MVTHTHTRCPPLPPAAAAARQGVGDHSVSLQVSEITPIGDTINRLQEDVQYLDQVRCNVNCYSLCVQICLRAHGWHNLAVSVAYAAMCAVGLTYRC